MNNLENIEFCVKYKQYTEEEETFYKEHNVDFFSCYNIVEITKDDECTHHEPILKDSFNEIINKIQLNPDWAFLDCGCGLGHPMYLAHTLFKKVYGVEIVKEIAETANKNLRNLGVQNFNVINNDIRQTPSDVMDEINVFFLFNPFLGGIFDEFMGKVKDSILRKDREVWVIYVNDICGDIMEKYNDIIPLEFELKGFKTTKYYHHIPN